MSDKPMAEVQEKFDKILEVVKSLGSPLHDPFMAMGFLALPVIPELKITDKGLVDVNQFKVVPLFAD